MKAFLSYARNDRSITDALLQELDGLGWSIWRDESLAGGQKWWDEILTQIRDCDVFVLAMSRHSLQSEACRSEVTYAVALQRPLLGVRIDDSSLAGAPDAVRHTQVVDFSVDDVDCVRSLARAVIHFKPGGPLPEVHPPAPAVPQSYRDRFNVLFGKDLPISDQRDALARLKYDIEDGVNAEEARDLLRHLHDRADVSWRVREDAALILQAQSGEAEPVPAPEPEVVRDRDDGRPMPVAGWYVDPMKRFDLRYWDGSRWSAHVCRDGQVLRDPLS